MLCGKAKRGKGILRKVSMRPSHGARRTIYEVNPEACRIFGMTEEDIIRGGRDEVLDASDPRLRLALEERTSTGKFKGKPAIPVLVNTIFI